MAITYTHFGSAEWDPSTFIKVKNGNGNKPLEGTAFWGTYGKAPLADLGKPGEASFTFRVKQTARILNLATRKGIAEFRKDYVLGGPVKNRKIDYEKLATKYDAIYVPYTKKLMNPVIAEKDINYNPTLYGWKYNTILIFNPNIIRAEWIGKDKNL